MSGSTGILIRPTQALMIAVVCSGNKPSIGITGGSLGASFLSEDEDDDDDAPAAP